MSGHDIVVIGTSAGGLDALRHLTSQLPADFPAAVFIVQHMSPHARSNLATLIGRVSALKASTANAGDKIVHGHIYIAPSDRHMVLDDGRIELVYGPQENRHRPAIDALFRSAAAHHGPRVIGIVLSGSLGDGTAGLLAIKRCGGIAIVQDPEEALYRSMPRSALQQVAVDHVLPVARMGALLNRLAREASGAPSPIPDDIEREVALTARGVSTATDEAKLGELAPITCPECGGPLWDITEPGLRRYRCRVGHVFADESLIAEHAGALEQAMWAAVRGLQERGYVLAIRGADL
ncbi:MAG TPA: chemotaxis protein CheB, partial [Burkholderiales bacterium]|nr:chemotaxis protein CheB [Burkholderiales bacterium]